MEDLALIDSAMTQNPTNELWMRMEGLRFRLRDSVTVDALEYGDRCSYLLHGAFGRQQLRLSQGIYQLLEKMDGRRTLAQVCALSPVTGELTSARQHEILTALTQLQAVGMLTTDIPRDPGTLVEQQQGLRRRERLGRCMRLLSPRLALLDPDRLLTRTFPWVAWLFQPLFLFVWLGITVYAASQALVHWDALFIYGAQRLESPRQWLLLIGVYPVVKGLHEMGHCYAAKSGGAAVHEMGVTFLVFLPVPYVDASAASLIADKYYRMLVGAAGIMVEVMLSSLALFIWLNSDGGLVRDTAFAVMLIGGVSTLLFNGNPLLRFDGYYVLADAIEIPNLSSRASRYYEYLFRRYLLSVRSEKYPSITAGERRWFVFYGAAAMLYRTSVSIGIAFFLIVSIPVLGMLLAAWLLTMQILFPLVRQLHYLMFSPSLSGYRARTVSVLTGGICLLFGALALASFPSSTVVDGIVLLPNQAVVRAEVDGFLQSQTVANEAPVKRGDVLFLLKNQLLQSEIEIQQARVRELQTQHDQLGFDKRVLRDIHGERLAEARADLVQMQQRQAALTVHSPGEGVLRLPPGDDRLGRFIHKGDMLGYIADRADVVIRMVATQKDASRIRADARRIEVRLAEHGVSVWPGELLGEVPLGSERLPSAALGSRAGGSIQVDARDEHGVTALERVFAFDVAIPFSTNGQYVGSRASVRIQHTASPLLQRWYFAIRDTIRTKIGPK